MVVGIDGNRNIQFIGERDEYYDLKRKLVEFNTKMDKTVFTEFCNLQLFHISDNIYDDIYYLYLNWYKCYPEEAKLRASPFKNVIWQEKKQ